MGVYYLYNGLTEHGLTSQKVGHRTWHSPQVPEYDLTGCLVGGVCASNLSKEKSSQAIPSIVEKPAIRAISL